jgi:hypothetical protein
MMADDRGQSERRFVPPPVVPTAQPLNYRQPERGELKPTVHPVMQSILAVFAFAAVLAILMQFGIPSAVAVLVGFFVFGIFARRQWRWKAFLPGLILWTCLTLLVVGTCFFLFSGIRHH